MTRNKYLVYAASVIAVQLIGFAGTFFTTPSIPGWYAELAKPAFNPPNWVFGPVWTLLFLLIGLSLGLVMASPPSKERSKALIAFAVQLALNLGWSYVFFYLHLPGWAVAEIMALILAITMNIYFARKISVAAGWLLVPYLLWVSFATALNIAIWRLN